mmetsp:Transcript_15136/g.39079  ORF Transcript_15136/g.39079 Transcript_15136/m.39079 type:complete len:216 (+) Transcript_15136:256-903(+)
MAPVKLHHLRLRHADFLALLVAVPDDAMLIDVLVHTLGELRWLGDERLLPRVGLAEALHKASLHRVADIRLVFSRRVEVIALGLRTLHDRVEHGTILDSALLETLEQLERVTVGPVDFTQLLGRRDRLRKVAVALVSLGKPPERLRMQRLHGEHSVACAAGETPLREFDSSRREIEQQGYAQRPALVLALCIRTHPGIRRANRRCDIAEIRQVIR